MLCAASSEARKLSLNETINLSQWCSTLWILFHLIEHESHSIQPQYQCPLEFMYRMYYFYILLIYILRQYKLGLSGLKVRIRMYTCFALKVQKQRKAELVLLKIEVEKVLY